MEKVKKVISFSFIFILLIQSINLFAVKEIPKQPTIAELLAKISELNAKISNITSENEDLKRQVSELRRGAARGPVETVETEKVPSLSPEDKKKLGEIVETLKETKEQLDKKDIETDQLEAKINVLEEINRKLKIENIGLRTKIPEAKKKQTLEETPVIPAT